jgi:ribosomal-protein-alanine N-acetyltransferase
MNLRPVGLEACFISPTSTTRPSTGPGRRWSSTTLLKGPGAFAVLGEAGEPAEAKGFILCRSIAGEAEILTIAVDPAARRRGWGAALVEIAAGIAVETAFERCSWRSRPTTWRPSRSIRRPVSKVGLRKGYYPHPDGAKDALVMRRALNS